MLTNEVVLYTNCEYNKDKIKENIRNSHVICTVKPGDKVVIKPNFVQEKHDFNDDWDYVITHPTVISAVLELVLEQLQSEGEIIICDAPMNPSHFSEILKHMPVEEWKDCCRKAGIKFSIIDLRDEEYHNASNGIVLKKIKLPGDPAGKVLCNLKDDNSEFFGKISSKQGLYGADYDISETNRSHNGSDNYYSVSRTVISADVFICLAKMKTHRKAGVTGCLKNLIGINTNKNLLPHHTSGTMAEGGDQFADSSNDRKLESSITVHAKQVVNKFKFLTPVLVPLKIIALKKWGTNKDTVRSGSWYGNDTLWRTILDLNKVLLYVNEDGSFRSDDLSSRKRYIGIVDGILAGEGNGPLAPDRVDAGTLICGTNPAAIDSIAVKIMGLDVIKLKSVYKAFSIKKYKLVDFKYDNIQCKVNNDKSYGLNELPQSLIKHFKPADGWIGHIEAST